MKHLIDYISDYTVVDERDATNGFRQTGRIPPGADLVLCRVWAESGADAERLREMVRANKEGEFVNVDLFDGEEHSYLELGAWIGDQRTALRLMGLGALLGLWELLTPFTVVGDMDREKAIRMARLGIVGIRARKEAL
jgi:hypothetical protein